MWIQLQSLKWLNFAIDKLILMRYKITAVGSVECGAHGRGVKTMCSAMLYTLIWLILFVFIRSSKNREREINDFAVIFSGI